LQEFAVRQNDLDMLGVISQAKVFDGKSGSKESKVRAEIRVQKTLLDYWKK